ncbi:hypothetical protein CCP3SC1_1300004 [Gammaproteobacteria bacterium]
MNDSSAYYRLGGELSLSNLGQLELLRGVVERGHSFRTCVRGWSMAPFIRDQDVLTIAPLTGKPLRLGSVVAFVQPDAGRLAIHRLIARQGDRWLIRGDNNPEADGIIPSENILGYVIRVERNGRSIRLGLGPGALLIVGLQRVHLLRRLILLAWHLRQRLKRY